MKDPFPPKSKAAPKPTLFRVAPRKGHRGRSYVPSAAARAGVPEIIVKRGVRRYDLRDPYHLALTLTWPQFFLTVLAGCGGLNVLFALLYILMPDTLLNAPSRSFLSAFFFSIETLATVGYGVMSPATIYGHIIASLEILTGMIFTTIMTGLIFVRFSRARAKILFADNPVIARHNGQPTLMIRLANGRVSRMGSATASLSVRQKQRTLEGNDIRIAQELPLLRSRLPTFDLSWTLMHPIETGSPFLNATPEELQANETLLILTIEARDHALGAMVYEMHQYAAADVLIGQRYQNIVVVDGDGVAQADLSRLSCVESEGPQGA